MGGAFYYTKKLLDNRWIANMISSVRGPLYKQRYKSPIKPSDRLYVLIDEKLDPVYGGVQGGHAVAQWLLEHEFQDWNNQTLVYLVCNIKKMVAKLEKQGVDFSRFNEPDLGGKTTAIALLCHNKKTFNDLKLLGSK